MRVGAVSGESWGIQGYAKETHGSGCKLPGDCRECMRMPGERTGVEAKCQWNAWECRGIQGNTGKCQGNVWEWVQSAR